MPSRGDVVRLLRRHAGEAFVVAEVEVRLCSVVRHEHLTVLVRAHRAGVDVEIGVELPQTNRIAACLKKCPKSR
jgi:phosphopantetheine adenylyltransferase